VKRIVEEFQPLATIRGTHVAVDVEPVPALLLAPAALRHIVLNLLDNAVKYGPTGQTVRVRVHSVGGEVHLEVADQGPGVPIGDRETVWQAYHRGSTAGHNAGSGLGLSIVHDVVALHGGRAWISDPAEGSGAVFVVALPAAPGAAHVASTESRATTHIDAPALP
jgi:signal transduction histidine kinase